MQRGKDSVQRYDGGGQHMLRALRCASGNAIFLHDAARAKNGTNSGIINVEKKGTIKEVAGEAEEELENEGELAGHIVEQLRGVYDELLLEPIPDHLHKLLADLANAEDKP